MKHTLYTLGLALLSLVTPYRPAAAQTQARPASAPKLERCGSATLLQRQLAADPELATRIAAQEAAHKRLAAAAPQAKGVGPGGGTEDPALTPLYIPVIFHLFQLPLPGNPMSQTISQAQVQAQLDLLNQDFNALNTDWSTGPTDYQSRRGNATIRFCLATRDVAGNVLAEPGIHRVQRSEYQVLSEYSVDPNTTTAGYAMNPLKGGAEVWAPSQYLNVFVCNLADAAGYGFWPSLATATADGIMIQTDYFGNNPSANKGRTLTHEVGHYFNLKHIWGDLVYGDPNLYVCSAPGHDDLVADTPNQRGPWDYGYCPATYEATNWLCNGYTAAEPYAMFMNYMDYSPDACKTTFTKGQVSRMRDVFNPSFPYNRASLLNSVKAAPAAVTVTHNMPSTTLCKGNRTPYRFQATPTSFCYGQLTYTWSVSNGNWTIDDIHSATPTITPDGVNGATVSLTVVYQQGTGSLAIPVTGAPLTISIDPNTNCYGSIAGPNVLCPNQPQQFTANPATSAVWSTSPAGAFSPATGYGSTFTTSATAGAHGYGTITVTYINLPGTPTVSRTIQVGTPNAPNVITYAPEPCPASEQVYTIQNFDPSLTYHVYSSHSTLPGTLGNGSNNPTFRIKGAAGDGWMYITASNACGTSDVPDPEFYYTFTLPECNGPVVVYPKQAHALYPNPASEQVTLSDDVVDVQVVNSYGKPVPAIRYQSGKLNVREAAAGLYHVRMTLRDGSVKTQQLQVIH